MTAEPRWATPRSERATDAQFAAELMAELGFELQPWQRRVLDVGLELDIKGGLPVHRDVVVTTPRQQGKSVLMLATVLHRLLLLEDQVVLYGAQTRMAARSRLLDQWWPMLRRSSFSNRVELSRGAGFEALRAKNGSILRLLSTTEEPSGHGESVDLVVLDECWSIEEHVEQAVRPATIARPGSQIWSISTAGTLRSTWWRGKVDRARENVETTPYFEWSAPEDADPADPATWRGCMPALGVTVPESVVAADFQTMTVNEFRRGYLNQWIDSLDGGWRLISQELFEKQKADVVWQ